MIKYGLYKLQCYGKIPFLNGNYKRWEILKMLEKWHLSIKKGHLTGAIQDNGNSRKVAMVFI